MKNSKEILLRLRTLRASAINARVAVAILIMVVVGIALAISRLNSRDDQVRVESKNVIVAADPFIGSLVTWDDYVAWMGHADPSGKDARILVHDLETKKTKTLAKGLSATGGPAWIRGGGDVLVYLSFARLPCDDLPEEEKKAASCSSQPRGWQMFSLDIRSGKRHEIAASKTEIDQRFPPLPEVSWPYVVWTVAPTELSAQPTSRSIAVYDLETNQGRLIVPGTIVGRSTVDGKTLVYTAAVPGADRWDLFAGKVSGKGSLERLTTSGKVIFPRSANKMVTWQEPTSDQADKTPDQHSPNFSVWVRSLKGRKPPVRAAKSGSNPVPGDGFVLWLSSPSQGGQLLLKDPFFKAEPIVVEQQPHFGAGWWAFDDRVVWATSIRQDSKTAATIHIARVTR